MVACMVVDGYSLELLTMVAPLHDGCEVANEPSEH
ncbi:hypothetical protein J2X75_003946 [Paenibacillus sp. 2003]|nr:hypothetical protein [Paenibacillus sp. 2003]